MPRYRKKALEIDAEPVRTLLRQAATDWQSLPAWVREAYDRGEVIFNADHIRVRTGHADDWATAENGDFVVRGVKGEIYPCQPDVFADSYEEV